MNADALEGKNLGKYEILKPLGRGGMARVYRAYHAQLDRYVAIKVLRSDLVEEEEFLARFRREAQAVAALRHPNIVQVFDFDVQDDSYYMVMELLEGDTLRTRLNDYRQREERMPLGEVVRILLDVLSGLGYAHDAGMVHRDVKPANILLTQRGQAVLSDFGIAQIVGGTQFTVSGALMGTLSYMSPEQGLEGQCDARSDLYSLGIVLYEMLMGDPPYDADTPLAILLKHVNDPVPGLRKSDPTIPKPFERVVIKALAKNPDARYQSASEMGGALKTAARKARTTVPDWVSLPLSFTTEEAPSEPVAVVSGTARAKVTHSELAGEETDARLAKQLAGQGHVEELSSHEPSEAKQQESPESLWPRVPAAVDGLKPAEEQHLLRRAILKAVAVVAIGNFVAVMIALLSGWWGIFHRGWPFEMLLIGLGLNIIMEATGSIWMVVPTGILLGNGFLFSYYALTGNWDHWVFLWPLEPVIIAASILYPLWLRDRSDAPDRVRRLARGLELPTIIMLFITTVVGAIVA